MASDETDPHATHIDPGGTPEGHGDEHAADHDEEPLGPVDWGAWAASLVGVGAGAMIALAMFVAVSQ